MSGGAAASRPAAPPPRPPLLPAMTHRPAGQQTRRQPLEQSAAQPPHCRAPVGAMRGRDVCSGCRQQRQAALNCWRAPAGPGQACRSRQSCPAPGVGSSGPAHQKWWRRNAVRKGSAGRCHEEPRCLCPSSAAQLHHGGSPPPCLHTHLVLVPDEEVMHDARLPCCSSAGVRCGSGAALQQQSWEGASWWVAFGRWQACTPASSACTAISAVASFFEQSSSCRLGLLMAAACEGGAAAAASSLATPSAGLLMAAGPPLPTAAA